MSAIEQKLRQFRFAEPFSPFELLLLDGRRYAVETAEGVGWHAKADALSVALADDSFEHLRLSELQDVRPLSAAAGAKP